MLRSDFNQVMITMNLSNIHIKLQQQFRNYNEQLHHLKILLTSELSGELTRITNEVSPKDKTTILKYNHLHYLPNAGNIR